MSIEKPPFIRQTLGDDPKADTFTVRLNPEERAMLEELKELLNVAQDSKALKIAARVGLNVLQRTFSKELLAYLFKKERTKLEDFKNF